MEEFPLKESEKVMKRVLVSMGIQYLAITQSRNPANTSDEILRMAKVSGVREDP